jgi:hypothetical protein
MGFHHEMLQAFAEAGGDTDWQVSVDSSGRGDESAGFQIPGGPAGVLELHLVYRHNDFWDRADRFCRL